jgi:bifunctional non-homologous end joining protein LigD
MPRWGKPAAGRRHPEAFSPKLAKLVATAPVGDGWLHEVKWDGYRIVATITNGDVRLWSRNGIEWTLKVPELVTAVRSLKLKDSQLDGEMIVPTETGSDFNALQGRLSAENKAPLRYMLFDAPQLQGEDLHALPVIERKATLEGVLKKNRSPLLAYSVHQVGNGADLYALAMKSGWEGIISKKVSSPYRYGERNGDWVKVKARLSDEFAVVGFTDPEGGRIGVGALMLAAWNDGEWVCVGRVGTGFTDEMLRTLTKTLRPQEVREPHRERRAARQTHAAESALGEAYDRRRSVPPRFWRPAPTATSHAEGDSRRQNAEEPRSRDETKSAIVRRAP